MNRLPRRDQSTSWPGNLRKAAGAASDAFFGIGKKPVPTRRQAFEARKAKRGPDNPSIYDARLAYRAEQEAAA